MQFKDIGYRYRSGAVRYADLAYVLCIDPDLQADGLPHTAFYAWDDGGWGMYDIGRWAAHSVCITQTPKDQAIALGENGCVRVMGNNDDYDEYIAGPGVSPGTPREIRNIGGFAYVCGMDRQVFKREQPGHWVALHGDMPDQPAPDVVFGFESIHGYSEQDVYAVGWHGEIWHGDGRAWTRCDSPTDRLLTRVVCAGDGWVYACGLQGLLIRGRHEGWAIVDQAATDADLRDMEWFDGTLYVATGHALYRLHDDRLELVDMGGDLIPRSCHSLSSADGLLWSVGEDDILAFDGRAWRRIE